MSSCETLDTFHMNTLYAGIANATIYISLAPIVSGGSRRKMRGGMVSDEVVVVVCHEQSKIENTMLALPDDVLKTIAREHLGDIKDKLMLASTCTQLYNIGAMLPLKDAIRLSMPS